MLREATQRLLRIWLPDPELKSDTTRRQASWIQGLWGIAQLKAHTTMPEGGKLVWGFRIC